ncbi:hypothetical protein PanWU01x14_134910 [Parasponia andersonii]|uniref:Uncharacterized protein n=1 Tax=Parasponia andersonii TaxID=3476 RepID=A0A2P5CP78_PARAD|nr:hypothetical protein PanWU01x14_134910 [Parasponia andersonii]
MFFLIRIHFWYNSFLSYSVSIKPEVVLNIHFCGHPNSLREIF